VFDETRVVNFEDFDKDTFGKYANEINVVCVATHYEGEPCDNTAAFYKWIKQMKKDAKRLNQLRFTVFGLGDTQYEQFNAMGKYFDQTFQDLKGIRLYKMGEGNSEFQLTEEQFDKWKEGLWTGMCKHYESINPNRGKMKEKAKVDKKNDNVLPLEVVNVTDD